MPRLTRGEAYGIPFKATNSHTWTGTKFRLVFEVERIFCVVFHTPTLLKWKERLEFEPSLAPFLYAPFLEMEHLNLNM